MLYDTLSPTSDNLECQQPETDAMQIADLFVGLDGQVHVKAKLEGCKASDGDSLFCRLVAAAWQVRSNVCIRESTH
jgi:hypothetical protein